MAREYSKERSAFKPNVKVSNAKPPKAIPKKSAKRKVADVEYKKLNIQFLTENEVCQICNSSLSREVHHKWSGKDRDRYYLDTTTWMALCSDCHKQVHAKPAWARKEGYLF